MLKTDSTLGLFLLLTTDIYRNGAETAESCWNDAMTQIPGSIPLEWKRTRAALFEKQMKGKPWLTLYTSEKSEIMRMGYRLVLTGGVVPEAPIAPDLVIYRRYFYLRC